MFDSRDRPVFMGCHAAKTLLLVGDDRYPPSRDLDQAVRLRCSTCSEPLIMYAIGLSAK